MSKIWSEWSDIDSKAIVEPAEVRVPANVAQFFDLEAVASDDEEEEMNEVDEGFIDDAPRAASASRPLTQWQDLSANEQEDLQKLADSIRTRYQRRVVLPENDDNPTPIPSLDRYASVDNHALYAVRIPKGTEYDFVSNIYDAGPKLSIITAMFREDVPGIVYLEVVDPQKLSLLLSYAPRVGRPRLIPVAERASVIDFTRVPVPLRPGWAYLRRPHTMASDVVFVVSVDAGVEALAAQYNKKGDKEFVIGVFLPEQIVQTHRPPPQSDVDFYAQHMPNTVGVPDVHTKHVLALGPGDAFVIPPQPWFLYREDGRRLKSFHAYWGRILAIRELGSTSYAACVRSIDFERLKPKGSVQLIPLSFLRHSFFREDRQLCFGDRVVVCEGSEYRGSVGRVVGVDDAGDVTVTLSTVDDASMLDATSTVDIPMKNLQICFFRGDSVEVTFGPHAGETGILVASRSGGFWIVYTGKNTEQPTVAVQVQALRFADQHVLEVPQPLQPIVATPAKSKETAPPAFVFDPDAVKNAAALANSDGAKINQAKQLLYTGDRFRGRQVRVFGGDKEFLGREYKGQTGQVVGSTLATRPPNKNTRHPLPLEYVSLLQLSSGKDLWNGAVVQVQLHSNARIVQVNIDHLQDTNTHLLLTQSVHVPWEGPPRPVTPPPPPTYSAESAWQAVVPRMSLKEKTMAEMETEQTNGGWLMKPELKQKRIDVVVDASFIPPHWAKKWTNDLTMSHGKTGYIVMDEKFNPRTQKAVVKLDPMGFKLFCPVDNLRPQRTLYIPHVHEGRESIARGNVRVIVIGCDMDQRFTYLGSHARVDPGSEREDGSVSVLFPVDPWNPLDAAPSHRFPLKSLCRSLNRQPLGYPQLIMTSKFFYMHPNLDADVL
ncbi:hypothetical protein R3P38DRAFT_3290841 [Favolaschia claudopus]|uniref:KOW domain-containing protein n=1 Tax=Favolaschia claudopus TaxID=2862362 RepID=A0AAV9ZRA3_9AGAR